MAKRPQPPATTATKSRTKVAAKGATKASAKAGKTNAEATKKAASTAKSTAKSAKKTATAAATRKAAGNRTAAKSAPKQRATRPPAKSAVGKPTKPASHGNTTTSTMSPPAAQPQTDPSMYADIRKTLERRRDDLKAEYDRAMGDLYDLQNDRTSEGSGDDQADTGSQTFEREQELALANGMLERMNQVEHALSRLDAGTYGQCERCGNPIPKARLEAFPAVTLCVTCKQREERR